MSGSLRSLYVCYLSLEDPLVQTQVVAYLEGLAARGHTIHLLTYEGELPADRRRKLRADLAQRGIAWHSLRYHKRPSLPATVYDVFAGAALAALLVRRHKLTAIHARNHVPAAMGLIARWFSGARLIFDIRGLMAEEYVDAGHWREGGVAFRITHWVQKAAIRRAAGIVVLTNALRAHLFGRETAQAAPVVIPCCVDLSRVNGSPIDRSAAQGELGLRDGPVMIYVGKFTGWYMESEMVDFFQEARRLHPGLTFLVLTQADPRPIQHEFERRGISPSDYAITSADHSQLGRYLAVADFGISFVKPCFSKISSSPTKLAEYLGAGLPVVTTAIGDVPELLSPGGLGVLVQEFTEAAYQAAARDLEALLDDPATAERCRALAREQLSLEHVGIARYDALYRRVAAG